MTSFVHDARMPKPVMKEKKLALGQHNEKVMYTEKADSNVTQERQCSSTVEDFFFIFIFLSQMQLLKCLCVFEHRIA